MTEMDLAFEKIGSLVKDFQRNESHYKSPKYSEAAARKDYIDKFWIVLGWDVNHDQQTNPYEQEVKVERSVAAEDSQRRADYAFYLAPNYHDVRFFVEAKKPYVEIGTKENYFQLIRYGWNSDTPIAALTDFEQFHVLDSRYRPDLETALNRCLARYHYSDYVKLDKFSEIYWLFSREAVANGSLEKRAKALPKPRGKAVQFGLFPGGFQSIDESFLAELDEYRNSLARNFKNRNPELDSETLTELAQRTLDRLVFLRFLEDKGIEPQRIIEHFGDRGLAWEDFIAASRRLDGIYNGIVYKRHDILDGEKFLVDENAFADICERLAHINSPYDFNAIPIHILGSIYERFLGKVIVATDKRAKVEEKPEVRKAGGVYYTPEYIVRYIVENTVGKLIAGKTPNQIAEMRFADIACGSGSFLLGIFDLLLDYHGHYYNDNPGKARKGDCIKRDDRLYLSLSKKKEILLNNIYGVDIDAQAVEVCQLSLYLKLLQEETEASAHQYVLDFEHEARLKRLLPDLSKNIRCGNSLIGTDILDGQLFPRDEERKLNPMNFEDAFPEVMKRGGFDAIVGNPPYLNVDDTWGRKDPRLRMLKEQFPEIHNDKTDVLFYFIGKAIRVSKGFTTFIVSRAFLEAYKADKLRGFIIKNAAVREVIDFRNYHVFPGVGITTCIIALQPQAVPKCATVYRLIVAELPSFDLNEQLSNAKVFEKIKLDNSTLDSAPWSFVSDTIANLNTKIDGKGEPAGSVLTLGQGMQTGCNEVFGGQTLRQVKAWGLKKGQYYKRATNSDILRYYIKDREEYLLYLEDVPFFEALPMTLQQYFLAHIASLKARAAFKRGNCDWWRYSWPLHKKWYDRPRILCPYLASTNRFAIDIGRQFLSLTDTTVIFDNSQPESLLYCMGLLNSRLLTFRFRSIGKLKSGGILEYFWNSVSKLPIRRINFSDPTDKSRHDAIVSKVEAMLESKKQLAQSQTDKDKAYYENKCASLDRQIDRLVYDLYSLTEDEIRIIEESH